MLYRRDNSGVTWDVQGVREAVQAHYEPRLLMLFSDQGYYMGAVDSAMWMWAPSNSPFEEIEYIDRGGLNEKTNDRR